MLAVILCYAGIEYLNRCRDNTETNGIVNDRQAEKKTRESGRSIAGPCHSGVGPYNS